ncbi:Fic family protein [Alkaliphilus hydrothermalis]|uniref:Fic family protein n=1 Tax=Alkaliphilus hydrothermalis TaxID=1482730 RepID=A0ABS2NTQ5_9FIRM|nr:Fic family protein [Alkaliphilus hydrothermalis]MBM7616157.1 Fic family protein [Alkaliphilus hydrothermalis]
MKDLFKKIQEKQTLLDSKRPLPTYTVKSIRENLLLEWTYNSNAIEGNTLTLQETKVVLEGITVGGKTFREHLEVINHKEAILYVEEIVKSKEKLNEWQIQNIHRLVLKGISDEYAGVYRNQNVIISGAQHTPPDFMVVSDEMKALINWYESEAQKLHPVERAAQLHGIFVGVHPFVDGNGRTARLLMNLELMKNGYPASIIRAENRLEYYNALDKAHTTSDYDDFSKLVAQEVEKSLDMYLKLL